MEQLLKSAAEYADDDEGTQDADSGNKAKDPKLAELLRRGQEIVTLDQLARRAGKSSAEVADLYDVMASLWDLTKHQMSAVQELAS